MVSLVASSRTPNWQFAGLAGSTTVLSSDRDPDVTTPRIELNRAALGHNIAHTKSLVGSAVKVMVAVKSNAYGHGLELVAPEVIAQGAEELAVLDLDTAVQARALVAEPPLLAWLLSPADDFSAAVTHGVELGISEIWQLDKIDALAPTSPVRVHLKIDTGLNRNGSSVEQWPALIARARTLEGAGVINVRAIWSHLADTSAEESLKALARLEAALEQAREAGLEPELTHLAASHAAVSLPQTRRDLVRLGVLAYGVSPFADRSAADLGYQPVLTLYAPVTSVSDATVELGVGYHHGVLPTGGSSLAIQRAGVSHEVLEVGVDYTLLAAHSTTDVQVGEEIALLGAAEGAVSVERWAEAAGTIGDEVLVSLRDDLPRSWA